MEIGNFLLPAADSFPILNAVIEIKTMAIARMTSDWYCLQNFITLSILIVEYVFRKGAHCDLSGLSKENQMGIDNRGSHNG